MQDLKTQLKNLGEAGLLGELQGIEKELKDRTTFVATVGQFSRGKSSLINALLGQDVLPTGIEPTTALIHILRHRKGKAGFRVIDQDAKATQWEPMEKLQELTISLRDKEQKSAIAWVEVGLEHSLLADGMVIVDTPGTDDMNELRAEVVYSLIPRADAVLMVLSATVQLHRTEEEFLKERLMKSVTPKMFFALNKMDLIGHDSEDEEERQEIIEEVIEVAHTSLKKVLPDQDIALLPVSSKLGDVESLSQALMDFKSSSDDLMSGRGARLLDAFSQRMETEKTVSLRTLDLSEKDCQDAMSRLKTSEEEFKDKWPPFERWLEGQGVSRIIPLLDQSLENHVHELQEDIKAQVSGLSDLKAFAGEMLPRLIEKSMRSWLDRHIPELQVFANRYCKAVSVEYESHFGRRVQLKEVFAGGGDMPEVLTESIQMSEGVDDPMVRLGLPAAGALVTGLALSGGFAALGMLGGHLLSSKIQRERKQNQKNDFLSELPVLLERVKTDYANQMEEKLRTFERRLSQSLRENRQQTQEEVQSKLQDLLGRLKRGEVDRQQKHSQWQDAETTLANLRKTYGRV